MASAATAAIGKHAGSPLPNLTARRKEAGGASDRLGEVAEGWKACS
jgi:hypothetical protein